ncbi:MAG: PIG-L deacetylase family protein [Thermoproteota archaeon]
MGIKILAFSAHTGDVEITAGGTILQNAEDGGRCLILHMFKPSGKWARPPGLSAEEYAEIRVKQALEASRKLNAEAVFLGCVEGVPYDAEEVKVKMYKAILEFTPDAILMHWKGSYHPDHLACHLLAIQAFERFTGEQGAEGKHGEPVELYYPENWEDPQGFQPEVYVDVSNVFEKYLDVIKTYDFTSGKYSGFNYVDYYSCLKRIRGLEVGFKYAEAFMTFGDWGVKRIRRKSLLGE